MSITHDDVSAYGLRWLLTRGWCSTAAMEISYAQGRLDAVGVSVDHGHELARYKAEWEHHLNEIVEARQRGEKMKRKRAAHWPKTAVAPQIGFVEAKATRADLMSDLRQKKMHTYSPWCSHAWLLVTKQALLLDVGATSRDCRAAVEDLDLPEKWGLLVVPDRGKDPISVISARRLREVTSEECAAWRVRIGRSLAWRALNAAGMGNP